MSATGRLQWLAGGGEMAALVASKDWSNSPLGPIQSWPQSLRTTVSLCLGSNFPINIIWGPGHNQIYNDGYRVVCGAVHPRAMGEDYRVTWASAWPAVGEAFERALAGETSYLENQRMFLERNGYHEETFFTFSLSPIRDESGKVAGLFHPVTETTATMLAERRTRALREIADGAGRASGLGNACELLLATLCEHAFDLPFAALYLTSADGSHARLRGVCGREGGDAFTPEVIPLAGSGEARGRRWPLLESLSGGRAVLVDVRARFGDVAAYEYPEPVANAFVLPVHPGGVGQPLGYLVVGASPRLPLDEKYVGFFEMLGGATTAALGNVRAYEMERSRAEALAELDRAKTTFFSNVSHEFRTPLTLMLGPLEHMLAEGPGLTEAARRELEVVHRSALRLLKLVNALLDFSRIEAGRAEADLAPTDLANLTRDLASAFRSAVEQAGLRLIVDVAPLPATIPVDRDMWEKIVLNLLSNAFKFTQAGQIRVSLGTDDGFAVLAVSDTGIGIPADQVGRIFERFHRVQGASGRTHEGTGIGLALVKDLALLHGGSASVESTMGVGSTFTVRIPLTSARVTEARPSPAGPDPQRAETFVAEALRWQPPPSQPSPDEGQEADWPRVLLADDNADMRDYVRRLLVERGYRVTTASDGRAALDAAQEQRPDLVLSDVMMPVMDGAELVRRLRAHPSLRTLPVILLSARAGEEETAGGLELGADDYLTKPFSARELLARVRLQVTMSELRRRAAEQEARAEERERVAEDLRHTVQLRDEFLSLASHELNTPLTSLQLQVGAVRRAMGKSRSWDPEKMMARMGFIDRQVLRMARLVRGLLEVNRISRGRVELSLEPVDLRTVIEDVLADLEEDLARAGCRVETHFDGPAVGLWDRMRLEQILTNVVSNALKYGAARPVEIVAANSADGNAVVTVRDEGIGIAEEDRERIFERFERAVSSENYGGFGLGLWIAKVFAEAMGGRMHVESRVGQGSVFTLELPLQTLETHASAH